MSRFEDYIRDIPMEIGPKFYPRPEIVLPPFGIPRLPDMTASHDFRVEHRAQMAYDSRNDAKEEEAKKEDVVAASEAPALVPSASTSSLPSSFEVLQPSRPDPKPVSSEASSTEAPNPLSFEEFESKSNVFDELEWRSIDNRLALSQILNGISLSEPATPNPTPSVNPKPSIAPPSAGISLPSYPVLNFSTASAAPSSGSVHLNGHNSTASYSKPSTENLPGSSTATPGTATAVAAPSQEQKTSLRQRLLTKGYRENLVSCALARVPHERIVHIEYYMKGISTLEKRGVPLDASLTFLLETGVTDKQLVLKRAETADQLLSMGFDSTKVFKSLMASEGDRLKALEGLLQS